jgi:hypothetical protein
VPTLTVKLPDDTFRKKPSPNTAYYPKSAYQGVRDMVFIFTPEDPQEWVQIEVAAKQMDDIFPLFLDGMKEWATKRFAVNGEESRSQEIKQVKSVVALTEQVFVYEELDEKKLEGVGDSEMKNLPTFGMF